MLKNDEYYFCILGVLLHVIVQVPKYKIILRDLVALWENILYQHFVVKKYKLVI